MPTMFGGFASDLSQDTNRRPSDNVWKGAPILEIIAGQRDGVFFMDDFITDYTDGNVWNILEADSTVVVGPLNSVRGGVQRILIDATDENEAGIESGAAVSCFTDLNEGVGDFWCEWRARVTVLTSGSILMGMGEPGIMAANAAVDATGAMVDKDFIGFRVAGGTALNTPTMLDATYNTASGGGVTAFQLGATGLAAQTLTASTWFKCGLRYSDEDQKMRWFLNGQQINDGLAISGANFPDGEMLNWFAYGKATTAVAFNLDIDWVRMAATFK